MSDRPGLFALRSLPSVGRSPRRSGGQSALDCLSFGCSLTPQLYPAGRIRAKFKVNHYLLIGTAV